MALEVFFREDIRNALLAAEHATGATLRAAAARDSAFAQGFEAGFQAALETMAIGFGLIQPPHYGKMPRTRSTLAQFGQEVIEP
jgi:hypothetical protein